MSNFYSNFIKLCAENDVTPSGAAKKIGLSNAAANGWKNGKVPSEVNLQRLADFFGVPVSALTGDGLPEEQPIVEEVKSAKPSRRMAEIISEVLSILLTLPEEDGEFALEVVRLLEKRRRQKREGD